MDILTGLIHMGTWLVILIVASIVTSVTIFFVVAGSITAILDRRSRRAEDTQDPET